MKCLQEQVLRTDENVTEEKGSMLTQSCSNVKEQLQPVNNDDTGSSALNFR